MNFNVEKIISEIDNADVDEILEFDFEECFTTLRKMQLMIECQSDLLLDTHAALRSIKNTSETIENNLTLERKRISQILSV
jgi:hypothetical protein